MKNKEYRVYQNVTQFAITVQASDEKEAIKIARSVKNRDNWDEYEQTEDDIFYDAVCLEKK